MYQPILAQEFAVRLGEIIGTVLNEHRDNMMAG